MKTIWPLTTIHPWSQESIGDAITSAAGTAYTGCASTAYPTANLALYIPFALLRPVTITKLYCVNGATGMDTDNIDIGIFSIDGTKLTSSGATLQTGANATQTFDIVDIQIGPGIFYLAVSMSGTTGTLRVGTMFANGAPGTTGMAEQASAHPLPTTATFAIITGNYIPLIGAFVSPKTST